MDDAPKKGFPTFANLVLVGLGICLAAIAIPCLLRMRFSANEAAAIGRLRSLVTTEASWRQADLDRNSLSDYWTGDVSGMYRIEQGPAGSGVGVAQIPISLAESDDARLGGGAALPGGTLGQGKGRSAGLIALPRLVPMAGYLLRAMKTDASGQAYATDADHDGYAWTNTGVFAFQARPEKYDATGLNAFFVNEEGVIRARDFGDNPAASAGAWPWGKTDYSDWKHKQ